MPRFTTGTAALLLLGAVALPASAQSPVRGEPPVKLPPTQRQSPRNPVPLSHGNAQNQGWMPDLLWGLTDANRSQTQTPYARVGDQVLGAPLEADGWTYPYPVDATTGRRFRMGQAVGDLLYPSVVFDDETSILTPPVGLVGGVGGVTVGAAWSATVSTPGRGYFGDGYRRSAATARTAAAPSFDPTAPNKFAWYPRVPGGAGTVVRYAIRVHIPEPGDAVSGGTIERRIADARYVVYYVHAYTAGGTLRLVKRRKVCYLSQDSAGDKYLVGDDGRPAYFPFVSEATYAAAYGYTTGEGIGDPILRGRVELDNTTEGTDPNSFVVADSIEFVQRPVTIKTSPTITAPHGGRKVLAQTPTPTAPYQQPAAGTNYATNPLPVPADTSIAFPNDSFDFANNPRDPAILLGEPFDPSNPSVLFQGPVSLVDPRNNANVTVAAVDAINHQSYRDASGNILPFFSHAQVLIARTEFFADPENGVPDDSKDGSRTIEVGSVLACDWLTGTVVWRWPDRTFLPEGTRNPDGSVISIAGLRNPTLGTVPGTSTAIPQVPGVGGIDRNGNGILDDDEVFIVGQGFNPNGGVSGAISLVPSISVLGQSLVPTYDTDNIAIRSVTPAPLDRYSRVDPSVPTNRVPIQMPVAFVAAANGVLYALDPFGNNDSRYFENTTDLSRLGRFRAGTTNVLWTFSTTSAPRSLRGTTAETVEAYYKRMKTEVPVTGPFVGSAPTVAWAKADDDPTLDTATEEPRLFVGNQNGYLYALDPRANAGINAVTSLPNTLPFRKGEQTFNGDHATGVPESLASLHRTELKWWFGTQGAIVATPAVSTVPHMENNKARKGVYATTTEGRVYCFDWDGPVTRADHDTNFVWSGAGGDPAAATPPAGTATAFNDDEWFHNTMPATTGARRDFTEGTIRPRWTFPNRYRNIRAAAVTSLQAADFSQVYPSARLAEPGTSLSPISSAPVLMDFPFFDRVDAINSGIKRYVLVAANDFNSNDPASPQQGRLLVLDQVGDRRDFLTNPMPTVATGVVVPPALPVPAARSVIYSQPLDQFVSRVGAFGTAAPVWTYRNLYDQYAADFSPTITARNQPSTAAAPSQPARLTVPTIYVGGYGRLYAIDIDSQTGLLLRWRGARNRGAQLQNLPVDVAIPGPELLRDLVNPNDRNNPVSLVFNLSATKSTLRDRRILARTLPLLGDISPVDGHLAVTAGPLQNRSNATASAAADRLDNVVGGPSASFNRTVPAAVAPAVAPVPALALPVLKPTLQITVGIPYFPFGYELTPAAPAPPVLPLIDLTGRYVNADIDDPLATTRGAFGGEGGTLPTATETNRAYSYPSLWATTQGGFLHEVSTNIEGEDPIAVNGELGTLGWALVDGDLEAYNPRHNLFFTKFGPGGSGSGIAIFTNAYYPSLDADFARRADLKAKTDPTEWSSAYPFHPTFEPVTQTPVTDFGDSPRPHFQPRPLYAGNAAIPVPIARDEHTGRAGFPLDLNGLLYDKRFKDPAVSGSGYPFGVTNNTAGKLRLPGYSVLNTTGRPVGTPISDGERRSFIGANAGAIGQDYINDNPTGQNVAWIFAGGDDGVLYGFTPVFAERLGGRASGFGGGVNVTRQDPGSTSPVADIFDAEEFEALRNQAIAGNPQRPNRDGSAIPGLPNTNYGALSRAAKGKRNIFEWGERVYIVVWDIAVRKPYLASSTPTPLPATFTVQLQFAVNGRLQAVSVPVARVGNVVSTYPYNPGFVVPATGVPEGYVGASLGMAFYELVLDGRSGVFQTPGQPISLTVTQDNPVGPETIGTTGGRRIVRVTGGATNLERLSNLNPTFFVANPLGVQAFLTDTTTASAVANAVGAQRLPNGIGPFRTGEAAKALVTDTAASTGTTDPDIASYAYSQALAQGNQIVRLNLSPYQPGTPIRRNPLFLQRVRDENGSNDPTFYMPVVTGTGYVAHGQTGSTDITANQRNLRLVNRSLMPSLGKVRARVLNDLIWRWWPGNIPNADAAAGNDRKTPVGMGIDGRINPLPWETPVVEPRPWLAASGAFGTAGNTSLDYPDILAATGSATASTAIGMELAGNDLIRGPVSVPNGQLQVTPNPEGLVSPLTANAGPFAVSLSVRIPQFQPANLVAMHSLTSTYIPPSTQDGATVFTTDGPIQLPRRVSGDPWPRPLVSPNGRTVVPFGYSTRVRIFVDSNDNGLPDADEPFRDVEVWSGVPVDMGLRSVQSPVDLGGLPGGFGQQNGLLGYGAGSAAFQSGFLPDPLSPNPSVLQPPYKPFFKDLTILNTGNVNLYNLRASQRVEAPNAANPGTGREFFYFGLRSGTVDPNFGILSVSADPNAGLATSNLAPNVVTSLDRSFDAAWDSILANNLPAGIYDTYYRGFGGRHTLHKARVGSTVEGAVLGLPDVPSGQEIGVDPAAIRKPLLGVSVPFGTPAGVYESRLSGVAGAPPMLSVFEDHDTQSQRSTIPYAPTPVLLANGTIAPAGPLYNGRNDQHPGTAAILPVGVEGVLRARAATVAPGGIVSREYQPHTNPAVDVKLTVTETPITGQIPDFALVNPTAGLTGVFSGLLPGIDAFPLVENSGRVAAALAPAAYRSRDGRLNVYFNRNADPATGLPSTAPGAPFKLFHAHVNWNATLGTFVAANFGVPLADPTANQARWFTSPLATPTTPGGTAAESNLNPFVLSIGAAPSQATLFYMNQQPVGGGASVTRLYFSRLDASGNPVGAEPFVLNPDPNLKRFGPRAVFTGNTTIALYYGGTPGQWSLYYSPRAANAEGVPIGTALDGSLQQQVEFPVQVPSGFVSTFEPSAVVRNLVSVGNGQVPVLDVYYSGVLRGAGNPDLYMTRFRVNGTGNAARLSPVTLPLIENERLIQQGRDLIWRAKHIAWNRNLSQVATLPVIAINDPTSPLTDASRWEYDAAAQVLYQVLPRPGGLLYIYVDTTSGTVRFRGVDAPTATDTVYATYQPQSYRLTGDGRGNTSAHTFIDPRVQLQTANTTGGVLRRPAGNLPVGRQWVVWQKGAVDANRPPTLYHTTRRVGIDLKSEGLAPAVRLGPTQSLRLLPRDANGNQAVVIQVGVELVPGSGTFTLAAFDVDFISGRVFVDPIYEGLRVRVDYTAFTGTNSPDRPVTGAVGILAPISEPLAPSEGFAPAADGFGIETPISQRVNEGQPYAFLDLFSPTGIVRPNGPTATADPTLLSGRVWLFWTSPRGRLGQIPTGAGTLGTVPSGYDLLLQTLAPLFETPNVSGQ